MVCKQIIVYFLPLVIYAMSAASGSTETPVIGILSQETYSVQQFLEEDYDSFIAASYVKFVESAGGRAIPIWIGQDKTYYRTVVNKTNGLLLPGGATYFNESGGYGDAGQMLYDAALELNKNGRYYPIFGICLGMELLAQVAIGGQEIREPCSAFKLALPLEFNENLQQSKLFKDVDDKVLNVLKTRNVTLNSHGFCLTRENFTKFGLDNDWMVMSTNKDKNNKEFISTFESRSYPFYGVQFHPEKNLFEFKPNSGIPHSKDAVLVAQYFANFFMSEARKNNNSFSNTEELRDQLIYNYSPMYTGKLDKSPYEQIYLFKNDTAAARSFFRTP